ncbi:unnamed protein product [Thelazia callipaeda]|uniref:Secreted protein n=1 Tax=Thelazia callipaeda TaxID=103827 RepID=A0A0N5CZC0_THECL|nr:unnamed protein product [Thelazia callipaeda]
MLCMLIFTLVVKQAYQLSGPGGVGSHSLAGWPVFACFALVRFDLVHENKDGTTSRTRQAYQHTLQQHQAGQDKTRQDKTGQGRAGQGRAGQDRTG